MIPGPWVALVLALAVFRACRLAGWDTLPLLARARAWTSGAYTVTNGSTNTRMGLTSEPVETETRHRRPNVYALLTCPFCLSLHLGVAIYLLWIWFPVETMYGAMPLALSAAAGLLAKNLDP